MSAKDRQLDRQVSAFLALRGHSDPKKDYWQVFREMMSEINHLRMVIKYPRTGRQRGRQPTAEINRERYQDLLGFLAFKHSLRCNTAPTGDWHYHGEWNLETKCGMKK